MWRRFFALFGIIGALWIIFAGPANADPVKQADAPKGTIKGIHFDDDYGFYVDGCTDGARAIKFRFDSVGTGSVRIEARESGTLLSSVLWDVKGGQTDVNKLKIANYDGNVVVSVESELHIGSSGAKLVQTAYDSRTVQISQEGCAQGIVPRAEQSTSPPIKATTSPSQHNDYGKLLEATGIVVLVVVVGGALGFLIYWLRYNGFI